MRPLGTLTTRVAEWFGHPLGFVATLTLTALWLGYSTLAEVPDRLQLIVTLALSFLAILIGQAIQFSQTRDTKAIQAKLSELILSQQGARNELARAESLPPEELARLVERVEECP